MLCMKILLLFFLAYLDFALVYNKDLKGIKTRTLGHHGVGFTWNVYEWNK